MAKRLTAEEARGRVIDSINLLKDAESADIDRYMSKYAVYRDMAPEEYEAEYAMITRALFGHDTWTDQVVTEQTEATEKAEKTQETEVTEEFRLPAIQDPAPVAVIEVEEAETMDEAPKADTVAKVAEAVATGAKAAARVAAAIAKLAVMAGKASLPWMVKGAKALYKMIIMVIYTALDLADAARVWGPYWISRAIRDIRSLAPCLRKGIKKARKAGVVAIEVTVGLARQMAGMAIVVALVAIKAGAVMAHGSVAVARECKCGWDLRSEILAEEREAA